MSVTKKEPSQSITNSGSVGWTGLQAYLLAAFCLVLGVALGYLYRGSASPGTAAAGSVSQDAKSQKAGAAEAQAALMQAASPYLEAVNKDPNDYDSLVKLGNLYYDAQQYPAAIQYYERAVTIHPENVDVRTDMGTAYWYAGNIDKAMEEMQTSLKYRPGHPQTLFNLGWIKWQGKGDAKGAVEAWQQLLKANPDYPQKQQVEQYIAKAKEHAARG
ncbi:MAG TPA: tetratricopeptide repeat protein [Candidatus Sulfotelmatobacter sp.]|nr:tetratricopeptide repeat protein [Candidatus Sulfotelmatobacter sp.]